jgi:hypothetical protein
MQIRKWAFWSKSMQTPLRELLTTNVMTMLGRHLLALGVLFSLVALATPSVAQKVAAAESEATGKLDAKYESWRAFQATERFSGPVVLKSTKGAPIPLRVELRVWSLDAGRGPQKLLVPEFTIFHLRAGTLKIVVNGKEEVRKSDDFWVLPAGSEMAVQVKGEAAVLETTSMATK